MSLGRPWRAFLMANLLDQILTCDEKPATEPPMIASILLLAAQAATTTAPPTARQDCVRAPGSEIKVCGTPPQQEQQQGAYRLPKLPPKA